VKHDGAVSIVAKKLCNGTENLSTCLSRSVMLILVNPTCLSQSVTLQGTIPTCLSRSVMLLFTEFDMSVTVCDADFTDSDMSVTACDEVKRTPTCLSRSVGQGGGVSLFSLYTSTLIYNRVSQKYKTAFRSC
jgi:hypothetical protein